MKIAGFLIFFVFAVLAWPVSAFDLGSRSFFDTPPEPILRFPTQEEVSLGQKDSLEFKWENNDLFNTTDFEFRLYRGYQMNNNNLIMRQAIPANQNSLKVDSSKFSDNEIYTWSLIRIVSNGHKSDASFNSFKIIKK